MQILLVVLVAVLVPSLTEALILSKCELKNHLEAALVNMTAHANHPNMTQADLIAKIVCHVEKTSGFNTSAVIKQVILTGAPPQIPKRGKRSAEVKKGSKFSVAKFQAETKSKSKSDSSSSESHGHSSEESSSHEKPGQVVTLYGLFQLSDMVCSSSSGVSPNLCQMDCTALIDDDISNDIACLKTIKEKMESGPSAAGEAIMKLCNQLAQKDCFTVVASTYFADC